MKHALAVSALIAFVSLGGCMSDKASSNPAEVHTHEIDLLVNPSTSSTIPLYTLNDGERQMEVVAMGFQIPGQEELELPNPEIRVHEGDKVIIRVQNLNPLPHTFHLHGGLVDWEMDGVPYLTQEPIHQGEEYTYVFEDMKPGTYFYHCHVDVAHHMDLGMYGAFIVEEAEPEYEFDDEFTLLIDEWDNCHVHGNTDPLTGQENSGEFSERAECLERFVQDNLAQNQLLNAGRNPICDMDPPPDIAEALDCGAHGSPPPQQESRSWYPTTTPVYTPKYNTYLINGKAFPDTEPIVVEEGKTYKVRLVNVGEEMHSIHLHGHRALVTHRDGYQLESPFYVDTLGIMPGERYDMIVEADNPGFWAFHDHVGLNVMNDNQSPGGMFTCMAYDDFRGVDAYKMERAIDCITEARKLFEKHPSHGTKK